MTVQELKQLVAKGEGHQIEFKRKASFPEKIVREIVAFANTSGGHLIIGVDDDGSIPGLRFVEDEHEVMIGQIARLCRPVIRYKSEIIPINLKRSVLHFHIYEGRRKPYYARENADAKTGTAYVRVQDRSIQASREIRAFLKFRNKNKPMGFAYGKKEKMLLNYLGENQTITLSQFQQLVGVSRKLASETIINLALTNVIRIIAKENEDEYVFAE